LHEVTTFVGDVCAATGLSRDTCLRLTLLVEELFTNTVVHGHGAESEAPVHLALEVQPSRVVLTYEDTAPAHDPFAVVNPPPGTERVEERPVGGLGVLLVAAMAERVQYARAGDKNRICLAIPAAR
jgi:serine/threonine-protein kinase RsbW